MSLGGNFYQTWHCFSSRNISFMRVTELIQPRQMNLISGNQILESIEGHVTPHHQITVWFEY